MSDLKLFYQNATVFKPFLSSGHGKVGDIYYAPIGVQAPILHVSGEEVEKSDYYLFDSVGDIHYFAASELPVIEKAQVRRRSAVERMPPDVFTTV